MISSGRNGSLGAQKDIAAEFGRVQQVPVTARLKTCGNAHIFMALAGERLDIHEMVSPSKILRPPTLVNLLDVWRSQD